MVNIKGVSKKYGNFTAVDNVSFSINTGEILGLLGPNGAGKTTIIKMLTGYHYPSNGTINIDNLDIIKDALIIKKRLGYLPENAPLYQDLKVFEYLEFVCKARFPNSNEYKSSLKNILQECEIEDVYNKKIEELSKGYRQRVCMAQAIIHNPDILILDEPTTGLDPNQIQDIRRLIKKLSKNKTIVLSTHIMQEVNALCDRIVIIHKGKIALNGKKEDIQQSLKEEDMFSMIFKIHDDFDIEDFQTFKELKSFDVISHKDNILDVVFKFSSQKDYYQNAEFIFDFANENKLKILSMQREKMGLEEIFSNLTTEEKNTEDSEDSEDQESEIKDEENDKQDKEV